MGKNVVFDSFNRMFFVDLLLIISIFYGWFFLFFGLDNILYVNCYIISY